MEIRKKVKKSVIDPLKDKNKIFRLNRFLSNWYVIPVFVLILDIILFLALNYVMNIIPNIGQLLRVEENAKFLLSWKNMFYIGKWKFVYKLFFFLIVIFDILFVFRVKEAFSDDYFNVGQKGRAEWATLQEIKDQYLEIDEKDTSYPGWGGCIVARYGDKLYIDQSDVSNVYFGISRGGKGEMFVIPSIEVYSRAENQPSIVAIDMKCEIYKMVKPMLEQRGYLTYFMNLPDPEHSMQFNILTDIIRLWKVGDQANAELLAKASSTMFFSGKESDSGDMKFFADVASDMCCAMVLASIEDCLEEDEKENRKREYVYRRKIEAFKKLPFEEQTKARKLYQERIEISEDVIMDGEILAIPDEIEFFTVDKYEKCINFYSIINIFTEISNIQVKNSNLTGVDLYFNNRPQFNRAKLRYIGTKVTGDRTKGSIFSEMLRKLGEFTYENIAKMTAESSLNIKDLGFGDKPIAVFLGVPSHDKSKYFLPTIFIKQVYFVLAQECIEHGKCKRKVKFIEDEFGNFPKIDGHETMVSFGAGLGMTFDIYLQDVQQAKDVYGDTYKTIINNCANKIWILSNDVDTSKEYSELLGTKSITDIQRVGTKFSLHKTYHENIAEEPLKRPEELRSLQQGECIVSRSIKRKDLKGRDVKPKPIQNTIENGQRFKFRYEYLTEIKNPEDVKLSEINTEDCSYINPRERVWDYHKTFQKFEEQQFLEEQMKIRDLSEKKRRALYASLEKAVGEDILTRWELTSDTEIDELMEKIRMTDEITEVQKRAIISVLEGERK